MGRKIRIVCTVGTSLNGATQFWDKFYGGTNPAQLLRAVNNDLWSYIYDHWFVGSDNNKRDARDLIQNAVSDLNIHRQRSIDRARAVKARSMEDYRFPGAEVQTIFRWLLDLQFLQSDEERRIDNLHVILLPSDKIDSKITAHSASVILNRLACIFPDTDIICDRAQDIKPVSIDVGTREEFLSSIANLFRAFDVERKDTPEDTELIICASGGYKSVSGFAMMYAQIHSLPCLYTFETSPDAFEVMSVPLGYAYASLDEEISMLKAISKMKKRSVDELVKSDALPRWVRDSRELADTLISSYKAAREKPFGIGIELFNRLKACGEEGKAWAGYIEDLLVHNWAHLWLGDQIPETVEHSRRHSKRLMEFTANLFRAAGGRMDKLGFTNDNPQMLALLIAAIYLHDIGHTAIEGKGEGKGFPLGLFPSAVRDLHHLLTGELLRNNPEHYFRRSKQESGDEAREEFLSTFVPLLAEHHRGYTVLDGDPAAGEKVEKIRPSGELLLGRDRFNETLRPLSERFNDIQATKISISRDHLLNAAALMRVIDGCDVQSDRVISQDYREYHRRRTYDEIDLLEREFDSMKGYVRRELRETMERLKSGEKVEAEVYKHVFAELAVVRDNGMWSFALPRRDVTSAEEQVPLQWTWGDALKYEPGRFIALSLADRIAFKSVQQEHFHKHNSVSFVLPVADGEEISVKLFPAENAENIESIKDIKNDIDGEYESVKDVLGSLKFKADIVSGAETAKEPEDEGI